MVLHTPNRLLRSVLLLVCLYVTAVTQLRAQTDVSTSFISCQQLAADLATDTNMVLIDVRPLADFRTGHLPHAQQLWRPDIRDSTHAIKGMAATAEQLAATLQSRGVNTGQRLVLYDSKGNPDAARLWWLLNAYAYHNVQLLDGGLTTWMADSLPVDTGVAEQLPIGNIVFTPDMPHLFTASLEDVRALQLDSSWVLLDTRTIDEFTGDYQKKGAARAGRIPGSLWFDWASAIDYHGDKRILPKNELLKRFAAIGVDSFPQNILVYCQSGTRSAHTSFVLRQVLDNPIVMNYDGSWIEWSAIDALPIETGPPAVQETASEPPAHDPWSFEIEWLLLVPVIVLLGWAVGKKVRS